MIELKVTLVKLTGAVREACILDTEQEFTIIDRGIFVSGIIICLGTALTACTYVVAVSKVLICNHI